jgi:hypothetical protein
MTNNQGGKVKNSNVAKNVVGEGFGPEQFAAKAAPYGRCCISLSVNFSGVDETSR